MILIQLGDDVAFVSEMVIEIARRNAQRSGDVIGGNSSFTAFIKQLLAGDENARSRTTCAARRTTRVTCATTRRLIRHKCLALPMVLMGWRLYPLDTLEQIL